MSGLPAHLYPDRLAVCFRTAGAAGLPEALTTEPRFAARIAGIVDRHYDLSEPAPDVGPEDRFLLDLSREDLDRFAARAGIVLHARKFLQEIRGPVLAALTERFGPDAMDDARRHADLAAADGEMTADLDAFAARATRDGAACLAAWIGVLPMPLQRRVQLKWPNDHAVPTTDDADIRERGPAILRRLVSVESQSA